MDALPRLIARLNTGKLAFIAFVAGALSVLSMAPFFLWPIMFATFPALVWTLDAVCFRESEAEEPLVTFRKRLLSAAFIGWAFGFGFFFASIYWIGYAFFVDAERYATLMPFAVASLPAGWRFSTRPAPCCGSDVARGYARLPPSPLPFFARMPRAAIF